MNPIPSPPTVRTRVCRKPVHAPESTHRRIHSASPPPPPCSSIFRSVPATRGCPEVTLLFIVTKDSAFRPSLRLLTAQTQWSTAKRWQLMAKILLDQRRLQVKAHVPSPSR